MKFKKPANFCASENSKNHTKFFEEELADRDLNRDISLVLTSMNPAEPVAFAQDVELAPLTINAYAHFEWKDVIGQTYTEKTEIAMVGSEGRRITVGDGCDPKNTCANNGTCRWMPYANDFFCSCPLGFEGQRCEIFSR